MRSTAVETVLHMDDFTKYFEAKRLGKLYFPVTLSFSDGEYLHIELSDLYKLVTKWRVTHTLISPEDIVAVVAFGLSVHRSGFREVKKHRWFFGDKMYISQDHADFIVVTAKDLADEEKLNPVYGGSVGYDDHVSRTGINIFYRGVNQFLNMVRTNDTMSTSALQEGVPIFFNGLFEEVVTQAGVAKTTPRRILWDENGDGFLTGRIQ